MNFMQALRTRWTDADSLVCVGLDPEPAKFPAQLRDDPDAVFDFCRDIVDATADVRLRFKPQIAHFAALGAEDALQRLIAHIHAAHPGIPVILDSKRGDIGSTAQHYATEAFDRYGADAVTANPYLGRDSAAAVPRPRRQGVVILCRTSNPGARRLAGPRHRSTAARPLYQHVAENGRPRLERQRQLRAGGRRDLAGAAARGARASSATCRSWCRASARRAATSRPW